MTSTFHGLETARRALTTQQAALYTTGHNIANANTTGYTRQRVNMTTTEPYPAPGLNRPQIPGQIGTGVKAGDIQRIRDSFTDMQYRTENSKLGYWQAKAEMLSQMEDIMNEPSDTGLSSTLDEFWNALQDLAVQPQNDGARRVVRERGITLTNTFNYLYNSLKSIQTDYRKEIETTQDKVNSILRQINSINKQIGSIEPHGYLPNDLYDERDRLVDELSEMINIRVETKPSGGLASANAEGLYDIYLATPTGEILRDSNNKAIKLVDSSIGIATGIHIQFDTRTELDSPVTNIKFFKLNETEEGFEGIRSDIEADGATNPTYEITSISQFDNQGSLKGFIEGYGYQEKDSSGNVTVYGTYNDMLADLDQMVYTFAEYFNTVHKSGWSLNEINAGVKNNPGIDFFDLGGATDTNHSGIAGKIKVSDKIIEDVQNIAAAAEGNVLSGSFERTGSVSDSTVGDPFYTGVFDPSSSADANAWLAVDEVEVTVKFDGSNWSYQFKGVGNPSLDTGEQNFTPPQTIFGIKIDASNVSNVNNGATWKITFSPQGIKAGDEAFIGDGSNALALANVKDAIINYGGTLTNVQSFYQGMIGKLGDNASEANRMSETANVLKSSVEERRMSESSVSLDEEMVNLIKFQHAYNAAARNITLIDEMLDKIINGMGIVGR